MISDAYRFPEVAVGEDQYTPFDPSYNDGTFLEYVRMIGGGHLDRTDTFTIHEDCVDLMTLHARKLQAQGYLLKVDADGIVQRAIESDIGY